LKFAENPGYLKVLKESGLNGIVTWIDSLKSPEVYKKMRGRDFSSQKMKALENIKKLKIAVQALQVLIKNFNEEEVGNLMNFCRKNDFINTFWVRGYQHMGRLGFSGEKEFLFDELIEIVADQSKGIYGIEDVYFFQKIIYAAGAVFGGRPTVPCYSTQLMVIPRHKEKSLNEIFNFKKFSKVLDEFGKVWQEDKGRAKRYFIKNYLPKLILNPKLNFLSLRQKFLGRQWNTFSRCPHYILVMTNVLPNILNFDIQRYKKQCKYRSFGPGEGNNFPDCYNYCLKYDTLYCNTA
jgi:MoaA/NifB/PqqE/SkfB family radical SAM enzyme